MHALMMTDLFSQGMWQLANVFSSGTSEWDGGPAPLRNQAGVSAAETEGSFSMHKAGCISWSGLCFTGEATAGKGIQQRQLRPSSRSRQLRTEPQAALDINQCVASYDL